MWEWFRKIWKAIVELLKALLGIGSDQRDAGKDEEALDADERSRAGEDLRDDPQVLSPPFLVEPMFACSQVVVVRGFVTHADISVEINGAVVVVNAPGGFPDPFGAVITLPAQLNAGDAVRARQRVDGVDSAWSDTVIAEDHTVTFPTGLPRPVIAPAPVHVCGARTGVDNLVIGSRVWVEADGVPVGSVDHANDHQGVNVNPDYGVDQQVVAKASFCGVESLPSALRVTQPGPVPLPIPVFDEIYEGSEQIRLRELANGARFTTWRNGVDYGERRTWGGAHLVTVNPPAAAGETFTAVQRLCPDDGESGRGETTTKPCSALPAPRVAPVQSGDTRILFTEHVPDARKKVFANGVKIGDASGEEIQLTRPVVSGETLIVYQTLGNCLGSTVRVVVVQCVAAAVETSPDELDLFAVGHVEYGGPDFTFAGDSYSIKGRIYYPAMSDSEGAEFHRGLADQGPVPVVFLVHGNHAIWRDPNDHAKESCGFFAGAEQIPNHLGYVYFQEILAKQGIASVAVYSNQTNCVGLSETNIRARAELIHRTIDHLKNDQQGGATISGGQLDFNRVGLFGHSRGGDAVVLAAAENPHPDVDILAVLSLAPTDAVTAFQRTVSAAFLAILPAADGDVRRNDGAKFYDASNPSPFKCQLYVHHANHNRFNRNWPVDDANVGPSILSRHAHERTLKAYGAALFGTALNGRPWLKFLATEALPAGVPTGHIHISFDLDDRVVVDRHEEANGITRNSLDQITAQQNGLTAGEFSFAQSTAAFNFSFFGNTRGMVAEPEGTAGSFRSPLDVPTDVRDREIRVRCAEVFNMNDVPSGATGFEVGLEDSTGVIAWVDVGVVGGLPRPHARTDNYTKTMPVTRRFPAHCFAATGRAPKLDAITAILIRLHKGDGRALAFDDLHLVRPLLGGPRP